MKQPIAKEIPHFISIHGHKREDPFFWLKDRDNPDVLEYLKSENAYCEDYLKDCEKERKLLYKEIVSRIKKKDVSVPYFENRYWYYNRYESKNEYPVICRKLGSLDSEEEVLLDVNVLAKGKKYFKLGGLEISRDNNLLAYSYDLKGDRNYRIKVIELNSGSEILHLKKDTDGSLCWFNDNQTLIYITKDESLRPFQVHYHDIFTKQSKLLYEENDEVFVAGVHKSKSNQYVFVGSYSNLSSEVHAMNAENPSKPLVRFKQREEDVEYYVDHLNKFCFRTNLHHKNFALYEGNDLSFEEKDITEIIPGRNRVLLEDMEMFHDFVVTEERKSGIVRLVVHKAGNKPKEIRFKDPAYVAYLGYNPEPESSIIRLGYTSLTTPSSVYEYDTEKRKLTLLKQQEVMGTFNDSDYISKRIFAKAADGRRIPISLVHHKNTTFETPNPTYLYGYGAYGSSTDPFFSSMRLSLLDRGFVYAIAHVRGGEDMGRRWYEQGRMLKKKNTFSDFVSCAEELIAQGYTSPNHLVAYGGSAGGLLMGVVTNERPELFKAVVAAVPFVDVVTTMMDEDIPLTTGEYHEWGNPAKKRYYDYMLSYSPYDNVKTQKYPAMFVTAGLHDSQVQYWEPAKWVAKLRKHQMGSNPVLLYTNLEAGHGGASGRFKQYIEDAMEFAFIFKVIGMEVQNFQKGRGTKKKEGEQKLPNPNPENRQ